MKQLFYLLIYNRHINYLIRNAIKPFRNMLPESVQLPPSGITRIKTENGNIKIATNQTNYVTHLLFWNGYRSFEYTDIFCDLIKKISCFYDIGANIGYYSLLAARLNPKIKIVAFEAADGPLFYLRKNIELNNMNRIVAEPIAISGSGGDLEFQQAQNSKYRFLRHNLGGEGHIAEGKAAHDFTSRRVRSMTLDQYVNSLGDQKPGLLKIDTEGTENFVLKGAHDTIMQSKPIIICETLFNKIEPEIENIARSHEYLFFNHHPGGLRRVKTIIRKHDDGVRNCFMVHPTKLSLLENYIE